MDQGHPYPVASEGLSQDQKLHLPHQLFAVRETDTSM